MERKKSFWFWSNTLSRRFESVYKAKGVSSEKMKYTRPTFTCYAIIANIVFFSSIACCQKVATDSVIYYSSSQIDSALSTSKTSPRLIASLLGRSSDGEGYLVGVRTQPGDVEIHEKFDDVAIIRSGHGVLRTGTIVKGQKQSGDAGAREWLGGVIEDAHERELSPGDFIVVPAMLAHQYIPKPGEAL